MINQSRAELLKSVAELCDRYPHWRLGQLIVNVAGWADSDVWDANDDALLRAAKEHLKQLAEREAIRM